MRQLISKHDLGFRRPQAISKAAARVIMSTFGLNQINTLYDKAFDYKGVEFATKVLQELAVTVRVVGSGDVNIPAEGPFIVVANYPHGALDTLIMTHVVASRRADTKLLSDPLFQYIEPLTELLLAPKESPSSNNTPKFSLRAAIEHLKAGHGLVIHPAGVVSKSQSGFGSVADDEWNMTLLKFIHAARVPIIPVFITGRNSFYYQLLGKLSLSFQALRLPRELLNKQKSTIAVAIAKPITKEMLPSLPTLDIFGNYLRANVYSMHNLAVFKSTPTHLAEVDPIPEAIAADILAAEIAALPYFALIHEAEQFQVYYATADQMPRVFDEISRLRQLTARSEGFGTASGIDKDSFDEFYHQAIIWDKVNSRIVAGFRAVFGGEIIQNHDTQGLSTSVLFEYLPKFSTILEKTLEVSKAFSIPEVGGTKALEALLAEAVKAIMRKRAGYHYVLGTIGMAQSISESAQWISLNYIKEYYWNREFSSMIVPRHSVQMQGRRSIEAELLEGVTDINLIDKLVQDIDPEHTTLSATLKKHLTIGAKVVGICDDAAIEDRMHALLLYDLNNEIQ